MAFLRSSVRPGSAVPALVLRRGDQVLRKEYPSRRLAIGTRTEADLQFQAPGLPDYHEFLQTTRRGVDLFVTQAMEGTLSREGHAISLSELIDLGVLRPRGEDFVLTLTPGMEVNLRFGDHTLHVGYGEKPAESSVMLRPARTFPQGPRPRLILNPNFRFAEIPALEDEQPVFFGGLFGIGLLYVLVLLGLIWAMKFVPPPPITLRIGDPTSTAFPYPPAIPDAGSQTGKKIDPVGPVVPAPTTPRDAAKRKADKLIEPIVTVGKNVGPTIEEVLKVLQKTGATVKPPTAPTEAEEILKTIGQTGEGSGGIQDVIARTITIVPAKKLTAETLKVTDPAVIDEATPGAEREFARIAEVMRGKQGLFKSLYNRLLRKYPTAHGRLTMAFTILPSGRVEGAGLPVSDFRAWPDFEEEVLRRLATIRFGEIPESAGSVKVEFSFVFNGP